MELSILKISMCSANAISQNKLWSGHRNPNLFSTKNPINDAPNIIFPQEMEVLIFPFHL